jgi:hypothetical protein
MDEPSQVRRAAREAVGETTPDRLQTHILRVLDTGSAVPGVLVLLSARTAANGDGEGGIEANGSARERGATDGAGPATATSADADIDVPATDDAIARRAAGVQLIYDGLRVTRTLAAEEPWDDPNRDRTEADMAILAADVLVARGFHLLARTECAARAVGTVRRFGRDQAQQRAGSDGSDMDPSERTGAGDIGEVGSAGDVDTAGEVSDTGDSSFEGGLEADAIDLAVRCGVTAVGTDVPADLPAFAADLAAAVENKDERRGFPPTEEFVSSSVADDLATLLGERAAGMSEGVPPATDG